jgi:ureidoacrylate peracid hydrolase
MEPGSVLETLEDQVGLGHTALVLVDIQNDFLHPDGTLPRANLSGFMDMSMVPGMVGHARELLQAARQGNVLTVFVQMLGDLKYQSPAQVALQRRHRRPGSGDRGGSVLEGTWGADFYADIRPDGVSREVIVTKYRYSAFIGTNLDLVLRSNGIQTLVMCGDATSGCVESTTRDGFFHDYYVVTAGDACADFSRDRHEASLRKMEMSFGYVVPAAEVAGVWHAARVAASAV